MYRLLFVDDDPILTTLLIQELRADYHVSVAQSLAEADLRLRTESFDLIVLDGVLPDGDGYRYCAKLRSQLAYRDIPIIFLTGFGELQDKIMGFSLGADDYLTKPFLMGELRVRIAARLKHSQAVEDRINILTLGDITVDVRYHKATLSRSGTQECLNLTSHEFKLLYHIASKDGEVCSRTELIAAIWGKTIHVTERTVDSHLSNLRKKLAASEWTIHSVHGAGYRWTRKEGLKSRSSA